MHLFKRIKLREERNVLGRRVYRGRLSIDQVIGLPKDVLLNLLDMGYQLPMAGGTSPQNQVAANATYWPRAIVVSTDQTINQGDMVWWDAINYTLKPVTNINQVAVSATGGFVGSAAGSNVPGVYPNPPAGAPSENMPGIAVQRGGSAFFNATITDRGYFQFQLLTVGADSQTVTGYNAVTAADAIGYAIVAPPVTARSGPGATPTPELDTSARVQVELRVTYPVATLV